MKKVFAIVLIAALLAPVAALAENKSADWWVMTESRPQPVKDSVLSGYWWWPVDTASNAGDSELWGNRGLVYGMWAPQTPVEAPPAPPEAPAPTVRREVPVFSNVLFDFDKSNLRPEGKDVVNSVVGSLQANPSDTLTVVGHTDSIGTDEYNMGLGQRRANTVRDAIVAGGINASRVNAVSRGESEPAVANDTPANRQLNRRVVFQYSIQ